MTCIVGIKTDKGVMMAADSCAGGAHRANSVKTPKVKKVGEYLIGYTSSFRMGQILHEQLSLTKYNVKDDLFTHLVTVVVPQIRKAMKEGGYLRIENNEEHGGEFLLAHGKRLFVVQSDFSVLEYQDKFVATGCGEEWATGAMYAMQSNKHKPRDVLRKALMAACKYSSYVRKPFHYVDNFKD